MRYIPIIHFTDSFEGMSNKFFEIILIFDLSGIDTKVNITKRVYIINNYD